MKTLLPSAEVFSRGLYVDPELSVPQKVLTFLAENQITPLLHHPTQLSQADLQYADFVFCMEPSHADFLADRYAQYSDKLWLLNDFAFGKETAVEDPIGWQGRAFEKQARLLQKAVIACAARLKKEAID